MKIPGSLQSRPEAVRAVAIVEELEKGARDEAANADVFAAFEELDALPPDVVRAVLTAWKGPPPDPEKLDAATRLAHGFPPPPLALQTVRRTRPARLEDLGRVGQEQLRKAGTTWDGLDLPAADRLRAGDGDASESSFAGTIEVRTLADPENKAMFDLVLYRGDSGAIFTAGSAELVGAIAYGVVEMSDRRARLAVQGALSVSLPHEIEASPISESQAETEREPEIAATPAAPARVVVRAPVATDVDDESSVPTVRTKPSAKKKMAAAEKTATSKTKKAIADEAPATKKKAAAAKAAPAKKKAAAAKAAPTKAAATKAAPAKKKAAAAKAPAKKKAAAKAPAKKKATVKKKTATKR